MPSISDQVILSTSSVGLTKVVEIDIMMTSGDALIHEDNSFHFRPALGVG